MNPTEISAVGWAIPQGIVSAVALCIVAYVLSQRVGRKVESIGAQSNAGSVAVGAVYAVILTRFLVTVAGIIGIFILFGPEWGVPCALCMIPIYIIGMVCGACSLARRPRTTDATEEPESNS